MKVEYKYIWDNKPNISLFTYLMNNIINVNKTHLNNNNKSIVVYSCFKYNNLDDKLKKNKTDNNLNIFYTGERFLDDINSDITVGFLPSNIKYNIYTGLYELIDLSSIYSKQKIMIINSNNIYKNKHLAIIYHPELINNYIDKYDKKYKIYIQLRDQEREHLEYLLESNSIDTNIFNNIGKLYKYISLYKDLNNKWINYGLKLTKDNLYIMKPKFCCFIVSNPSCWERNKFFKMLSEYKTVDSLGKLFKNIDIIIPSRYDKDEYYNIISKYRFMITFENHSLSWYHTEKIYNAFQSQTIPIYWGDPLIHDVYNFRTFIYVESNSDNILQLDKFTNAIDTIIHLENNPNKYISMFKYTPILYPENEDSRLAENCYYLANNLFNNIN